VVSHMNVAIAAKVAVSAANAAVVPRGFPKAAESKSDSLSTSALVMIVFVTLTLGTLGLTALRSSAVVDVRAEALLGIWMTAARHAAMASRASAP
jgi:hypothetical protein